MSSIHPFVDYPFAQEKLAIEIQHAINHFEFYITSNTIEKIIYQKKIVDSNTQLCLAYFTWLDAMETEGDSDKLNFGNAAITILNTILEKEPTHKPSLKLKKFVENQIKKVEKGAKKLDKFYRNPLDELTSEQAKDFAYALSDFKKDKISKEIEAKLWLRLFNETPEYEEFDKYGLKFYYLCRTILVLVEDLKQFDSAKDYINQVIYWETLRDIVRYDNFYYTIVSFLFVEAIGTNNAKDFLFLLDILQKKCQEMFAIKEYDWQYYAPAFNEDISCKVLAFAIKINNVDCIQYILSEVIEKNKYLLTKNEEFKQKIIEAKTILNL